MQLSTSDKIKMFAAFGAAVLTIIAHILIREWYQPDVRYELGSHYISGASAITSLKLSNMGHLDAEKIRLVATFHKKLVEITSDNKTIPFKILDGGVGAKYISGEIDRLVPQQEVYIYFALDYQASLPSELNKKFLQEITFKGGKGKSGKPLLWELLFAFVGFIIVVIPVVLLLFKLIDKRLGFDIENMKKEEEQFDNKVEEYHNQILELISMAENCRVDGKTSAEFEQMLNEYLDKIEFRKTGLRTIATKKYKNLS